LSSANLIVTSGTTKAPHILQYFPLLVFSNQMKWNDFQKALKGDQRDMLLNMPDSIHPEGGVEDLHALDLLAKACAEDNI